MSLLSAELGVMEPQVLLLPRDVHSHVAADEALELADAYPARGRLDEAQRIAIRASMGLRKPARKGVKPKWAATTVGDFMPRQNGKGDKIQTREGYGLTQLGERILHTAHEAPTATEAHLRLVEWFESYDDLRRLVSRVTYGNGNQSVELRNGGIVAYRTRTGGGSRGLDAVDLLVADEAQHAKPAHMAASTPTLAVSPNPQTWYAGSGAFEWSEIAWGLLLAALSKTPNPRLAFIMHTAQVVWLDDNGVPQVLNPDPEDRHAWATANPTYGRRITDEYLEDQLLRLGPELFSQEHLCVWVPPLSLATQGIVSKTAWAATLDPASPPNIQKADRVVAWEVSPDRTSSSIGWVALRADGCWHQEVVERADGTDWVPARVASYVANAGGRVRAVAVVKGSPGFSLVPDVRALLGSTELVELSASDFAAGCGSWVDKTVAGTLRRSGATKWLDDAVRGAMWQRHGEQRVFDRRNSRVDISSLVAVTAALRALETLPPSEKKWSGAA